MVVCLFLYLCVNNGPYLLIYLFVNYGSVLVYLCGNRGKCGVVCFLIHAVLIKGSYNAAENSSVVLYGKLWHFKACCGKLLIRHGKQ